MNLFRIAAIAAGLVTATGGACGEETFTRIEQIRALSLEEARLRHPVRILGQVTFFDGNAGAAFIQDSTGGIYVRAGVTGTPGAIHVEVGDRVEVIGVTWAITFSPSIAGAGTYETSSQREPLPVEVKHYGKARLPPAPQVPFAELFTNKWHDQFVTVTATIRQVEMSAGRGERPGWLLLSGSDGRTLQVRSHRFDLGRSSDWINRQVRMQVVVAGAGTKESLKLWAADTSWITDDSEAVDKANEQNHLPYDGLLRYRPPSVTRVKVVGTISKVDRGTGFYLTDGTRGLRVGTAQQSDFMVGDVVRVLGYVDEEGLALSDGIVTIKSRGVLPASRLVNAGQVTSDEFRNALVSTEGNLKEFRRENGRWIIESESLDGKPIVACSETKLPELELGSRIMMTGIVRNGQIMLRGVEDVIALAPPPWITPRLGRIIIVGAVAVFGVGSLWLVLLRLQVSRQTRLIEAQVVHRTLTEERRRISRELHDSLEQHLVGLHLHMDLLRDRISTAPDPIRKIVDNAVKLLEHCREETRRSVFDLKTETLIREGLVTTLRNMAEETSTSGHMVISVEASGEPFRLDSAVEFQLLRCAQEAITNAMKHSAADNVLIELSRSEGEACLRISDDGKGFNPDGPSDCQRTKFGLSHLRDRAERIQANLEIRSQPGSGTSITLTLPVS